MDKKRKTVVITGASRGIGHHTALKFLKKGWQIITCSRDEVPKECKRDPNWTTHIPTDLGDRDSVRNFIAEANAILDGGPLHGLVNNAGLSPKTPFKERLGCLNGDIDAWREVFDINVFAALKLSRGFAAALHKGSGAIVNVTSIAGHSIHPFAGSAYSVSKAALSGLTRELANEFAALGVRVNAVAPGEIETSMIQPEYEALIPRIPLERMGTPEDVANVIYFLCSDEASYVTGDEIWITGGQHMF
ncbi:SDR family NAD(P)-dependent oxidoreductase [Varunaivibrio sulfuroxidans]|uniref:NAD(P)-dependent dehydrogenase (Short-subunit alcohol dehydrogenase family) n=1 Tax=Varunaivibrio sulfuroxidans TaxID=1773489 RepID=A0A4R3J526_9PROT|nr:SDR family oxidoreductase [Varunaivibrio sulfuroxidans]TCS60334.1 NAD(P)-dependent dehydrogenase (short-subunit alcohol dehydrogenase family) [Varunaivibrio sulfuroxidans]WES30979.1 SDR family NAD(P)-dependent oxidoreductase [Varunaivibrio sulfuroxidans]